jgi:hypothetical protein
MTVPPQSGVGVDAFGAQVVDPTKNVLDLVQANKVSADTENALRDRVIAAEIGIVSETVKWLEKVAEIHQRHDREIHLMEQQKLAAFRTSDEAARLTEANRQLAAIEVLARTTQTNADNLRNALDTTAATIAKQNAETNSEIYTRLAALEKSSYEGAGKGTGAKNLVTYAIIAVGLLVSLITIGSVVVGIAFAIRQ